MKKSRQKEHKKNSIKDIDQKQWDEKKCPKTKSIIDFDQTFACSVKSPAMKKNVNVKPITRFFSGKMLMFSKIPPESFAYDFTKTFNFPNKKKRKIYNKYVMEHVFPHSVLTDTDSICVFFIFIRNPESDLRDSKFVLK